MKKVPMFPVRPDDPKGTEKRYREVRIILKINGELIPICWSVVGKDGSVSFGLISDATFNLTGSAFTTESNKLTFNEDECVLDSKDVKCQNIHATLHPSGISHLRATNEKPILKLDLAGWFPVTKELIWLQAYTAPIGTLPRVEDSRIADVLINNFNLESSASIQVAIFPRTHDLSIPIINESLHTIVNVGPNLMLRITIDTHQATVPTILIKKKSA